MIRPTVEQLRDYALRSWDPPARAQPLDALTPEQALELSQMLWDHTHTVDPQWPDEAQRREDLAHHQQLVHLMAQLNDAGFPR